MLIGILIALAVAPATAGARWPGPLDILREHPWQSVGGLAVVAAALAAASVLTADAARASANLGAIADQLARAVRREWLYEIERWRVLDPYPLPVRWHPAGSDLVGEWSTLVTLATASPGDSVAAQNQWASGPVDLYDPNSNLANILRLVPTGRLLVLGLRCRQDDPAGKAGSGPAFRSELRRGCADHISARVMESSRRDIRELARSMVDNRAQWAISAGGRPKECQSCPDAA